MQTKSDIRARLRAALPATTAEQRAVWSAGVRTHVLKSALWQRARTVLLFAALPSEPDLRPLLAAPEGRDKRLAFPSMDTGDLMQARLVTTSDDLMPGRWKIIEPVPERCPPVAPEEIELILCAGVAFARDGVRLGRGRGHYDRFLPLALRAVRCGVCFACQLYESLPVEPHDVRMHWLVTEEGLTPAGPPSCESTDT